MAKSPNAAKYILYARKSTESEDRQVLSIESQISELKAVAQREGLQVVRVMQESRSAKELGRPVFAEMIERIARGEASGILCWKLDRLARNFIDGGQVIEMIQRGVVQHIRSFERSYYPEDNVLLMAVELGMANQFSRDLAVNVKRGLRTKAQMGWYPVQPPLGYINSKTNEKGSNTILVDPERFPLVHAREAFKDLRIQRGFLDAPLRARAAFLRAVIVGVMMDVAILLNLRLRFGSYA